MSTPIIFNNNEEEIPIINNYEEIYTKMATLWRERIVELNKEQSKYNVPNIENLVFLIELHQVNIEDEFESYFQEILVWCLKVSSVTYDSFYDEPRDTDTDTDNLYDGSGNEDEEGLY